MEAEYDLRSEEDSIMSVTVTTLKGEKWTTARLGKCVTCGHSEDDHYTEEDNSYCLGNLAERDNLPLSDYVQCQCHEYKPEQ